MASGLNYGAFLLAFLALIGMIFTTAFWEWKRTSYQSSQSFVGQTYIAEGLWVRCTFPLPGQFRCDSYDVALIGLPPEIQAMRAMMCLSVIFSFVAVASSVIVLPCTNFGDGQKNRIGRVGGILSLLAGGLTLGAVSWFAANVIYDFFYLYNADQLYKFEFGSALYVGWVSAGLAIIAGILLTCCNCGGMEDKDDSYRYTYRPPQSNKPNARPAEYV